jgi:deazaflavin-dependent oxidoreductase (nitroreductase family)
MSTEQRQLPRAARPLNKAAAKIAGRRFLPLWALVRHRGRKSGKPYETPIAILGSTSKDVYIALPWGRGTDWVRNLQATGGGTLAWKGQVFSVTEPTFVDKAEALDAAPGMRRRLARRWMPEDCLRLRLKPDY